MDILEEMQKLDKEGFAVHINKYYMIIDNPYKLNSFFSIKRTANDYKNLTFEQQLYNLIMEFREKQRADGNIK